MRSFDSTVGVSVRPMPKGLYSMLVVPRPCGAGTGSSPPARKLALWPDSATSVGSASTRAMPLPSRKPTFNPIPALPKLNSRLKAWASGLPYSPLMLPSDANVADFRDDGVKEPKLNPLELARVLKMLRPACLSTLRLNSTTLTSTCTVLLRTLTMERSTSGDFSPPAANAVSRAS
ncbi:hypothetical protein D9M68_775750 [compost metagenome]